MGKIISSGLAMPDDPMFTGVLETFVARRPTPPPTPLHSDPTGEKQAGAPATPHKGLLKQLKDQGLSEEQAMTAILDI